MTAPEFDPAPFLAWLAERDRHRKYAFEERYIDDARNAVLVLVSRLRDVTEHLPAAVAHRDEIRAAEKAKAAGHPFAPSDRLGGRCGVCEGYGSDHEPPAPHRFVYGDHFRCKVCHYDRTPRDKGFEHIHTDA